MTETNNANEILDQTLYETLNLLGAQLRENKKNTDICFDVDIEIRCFDVDGKPYRYKITLTKEDENG
jgi:hypothetical protein